MIYVRSDAKRIIYGVNSFNTNKQKHVFMFTDAAREWKHLCHFARALALINKSMLVIHREKMSGRAFFARALN